MKTSNKSWIPARTPLQRRQALAGARTWAELLIAGQKTGNQPRGAKSLAAFRESEQLRPQLAALMGNGGFRALLARALTLAAMQVSWLRLVQVKADGSLEVSDEGEKQADPVQLAEGRVVLLAKLLELLAAFIGEKLTLRLVKETWPTISLKHLDFGEGESHEKTK